MSKNLNESQSMGEMHTKGMMFVFNELKNAKGAGFLVLSDKKSDKSPLYMAKQYVLSFIKKEYDESYELQSIALKCADDIFNRVVNLKDYQSTWFKEDEMYLSSKQKELLKCLQYILLDKDLNLKETLSQFDVINQRVSIECDKNESELMFNAISVGKASCSYWHDHLIEWIELLSESRERGWFSWKSVIGNDIGGAIGGAIAGAIFGGGAGAGPASISGAIVGSVSSAVVQVIEHEF